MALETSGEAGTASASTAALPRVPSYARTSLWIALAATLAAYVLGMAFFAYGGIFAPLSDLAGLAFGAALLPVAWGIHQLHRDESPRWSLAVLALGLLALALVVVGSGALVLVDTGILPAGPYLSVQFAGTILEGVWLLGVGVLALGSSHLERRVGYAALAAGLGYAAVGSASTFQAFDNPLVYLGAILSVAGFVLWAWWLGRSW